MSALQSSPWGWVSATPAAVGGGRCNRLYGLAQSTTPGQPAVLLPPGVSSVPTVGSAGPALKPLVPVAATAGALMFNTYAVQEPGLGPGARGCSDCNPWVTTQSFGPLTNAAVLPVRVAPVDVRLGGWWGREGPARPVAETAVGYVAQQDWNAQEGTLAPVPTGPGCFMPSWPGSLTTTSQGSWTATPWRRCGLGCPGLW
jgi:hypothetical protein